MCEQSGDAFEARKIRLLELIVEAPGGAVPLNANEALLLLTAIRIANDREIPSHAAWSLRAIYERILTVLPDEAQSLIRQFESGKTPAQPAWKDTELKS